MSIMDTKVNKSGDTMTGNLKLQQSLLFNSTDGAYSSRFIQQADGNFVLYSHDGLTPFAYMKEKYLLGIGSDHDNSILTLKTHGANWRRFGDGTQICWDTIHATSSSGSYTFPQPFIDVSVVVSPHPNDATEPRTISVAWNTTTLLYKAVRQSGSGSAAYNGAFSMLAIGRWY